MQFWVFWVRFGLGVTPSHACADSWLCVQGPLLAVFGVGSGLVTFKARAVLFPPPPLWCNQLLLWFPAAQARTPSRETCSRLRQSLAAHPWVVHGASEICLHHTGPPTAPPPGSTLQAGQSRDDRHSCPSNSSPKQPARAPTFVSEHREAGRTLPSPKGSEDGVEAGRRRASRRRQCIQALGL